MDNVEKAINIYTQLLRLRYYEYKLERELQSILSKMTPDEKRKYKSAKELAIEMNERYLPSP